MYIIGLLCYVFLYMGSARNLVESTEWVDDLMRYAVADSKFHQVKLMTRLDDDDYIANPVFDELSIKVLENLPTLRNNFGEDFELPVNSVPDETVETRTPIDTSATLFLFVIESRNSFPIAVTKKFIDAVAEMSSYHYSPKYLVISFVREQSESLEELLQYAWTKKMLDFTIVELAEPEVPRRSILIERPAHSPMIHQLNPFKKVYLRGNWTIGMNPIPSKIDNMWGYPLRVYYDRYNVNLHEITKWELIREAASKLNSSVEIIDQSLSNKSDVWRATYTAMESQNYDVSMRLGPYMSNSWNHTQKTAPLIMHDEFCAFVPIQRIPKSSISTNSITASILVLSIVLIIWLFMRLLGFKTYSWRMFNIGRVLFGISVIQQPRGNVERIIFTCLLALSAIYSSTIYGSITDITLQKDGELEYKTIADLDNSGLQPYIETSELERASSLFNGPLKKLGKNIVFMEMITICPIFLRLNVTPACFMSKEQSWSILLMLENVYKRPMMKIAKPCFWSDSYGITVGKRSPYRSTLDKIIARLHSSGIGVYLRSIIQGSFKRGSEQIPHEEEQHTNVLYIQLMAISIVGYSLSFLVFCGEIIYHRILMYIKSKVRPLRPSFP